MGMEYSQGRKKRKAKRRAAQERQWAKRSGEVRVVPAHTPDDEPLRETSEEQG